jgi:predicted phage terminase large subunit-like protein
LRVIQASHTAELAIGFGRKVRNIIDRNDFQSLFPGVSLSADSKAAGRWSTNKGGEYFAIGAEGAVAGKGADLFIIDDPHSEQDAVLGESNPETYDKIMAWYEGGPRQRLQPGGAIIVVMTRWSLRDLTGQLIKKQQADARSDQWEVVELPAILPSGKPIWPEYWNLEELLRTKASIPISKWNAQYQQTPTSEEGALIKRDYWQNWDKPKPPKCDIIMQSWDTAFTTSTRANYSACTTWGVFFDEEEDANRLIMLDAIRGKWDFPTLKVHAKRHYDEWEPDICLIEARAAGHSLIYELRQMGIPIQDVVVGRGSGSNPNDKISRVNAITDIFASKMVYAPKIKMWAQEVIEECAAFPAGENDDYVDTVTMAIQRFRQGGWIGTVNDDDEDMKKIKKRKLEYY